jgi:HD-like signal output (HDOD) protein
MTSFLDHRSALPETLKGKDDYVRTVLLTELLADHLPRLPWFLKNLQCALDDSSTVLEKACAALEVHPRICADFIRISSMAERVQPIAIAVDQLVVLLGKERVWNTAVAAFLLHELNSTWSSHAQKAVASIAMTRANNARVLASEDSEDEESDPEQAYVSEILSIIGLLPLLHFSNDEDQLPDWLDVSAEAVQKQRESFGTDFLELGRWARLLWKLPLENPNPEVMFQAPQTVSYSQILPKDLYSPLAALNAGSESRNLVLVSKGTV